MADEASAGVEAFNQRSAGLQMEMDNLRKNHAFNALATVYGPIAGDPERAQATENYFNSVQQDPLKTQGLALNNQATDLSNQGTAIANRTAGANQDTSAALRAAQFLKLHANPDGSINPDAISSVLTPQNAQLFGMDPAHLDPMKQLLGGVQGAGAVDHIISALQAGGAGQLQGSVQYGTDPTTGAPIEILHTKSGQTIVRPISGGATPTILTNAGTAAFRAQTGRQNAGTAAFNAGVHANNSEFGSPDGATAPGTPPVGARAPAAAAPAPVPLVSPTVNAMTNGVPNKTLDKLLSDNGGTDAAIMAAMAGTPGTTASGRPMTTGAINPDSPRGQRLAAAITARAAALVKEQNGGTPNPNDPANQAAPLAPAAVPPTSLFAKLPPKGHNEAISTAQGIVNQATNLQTINTLLDSVDHQIGAYTAGGGSLLANIPGTGAVDLKANLASIKAAGLTAWINSLKNGKGQTGIGRVLQSEASAAMAQYGNMEQDQSASQLRFHAQLFRRAVNNLFAHSQSAFHAQYGVKPEDALGVAPVSTAGAPPTPAAPLSDADLFKKYGIH